MKLALIIAAAILAVVVVAVIVVATVNPPAPSGQVEKVIPADKLPR